MTPAQTKAFALLVRHLLAARVNDYDFLEQDPLSSEEEAALWQALHELDLE